MQEGDIIDDRFCIERLAASGGMGSVYRAIDRTTGDPVAVKILNAEGAQPLGRFAREAQALAAARVPGVVRYVAHGATAWGQPYLAMGWLDGETLSERLTRQGVTLDETVELGLQVARTLGAVHKLGIVHRDLKPSNLLLEGGSLERVVLIDFGLARVAADEPLTVAGLILGTPGYMAPEQARGELNVDARADVFALGCILYRCLTGRAAFQGNAGLAVLMKVLLEDPPRVRELRPAVPAALDALIARMLAKSPSDRPRDGDAVAAKLAAMSGPESLGRPHSSTRAVELTTGERRVMCLVVTRERPAEGHAAEEPRRAQLWQLHDVAEQYRGELELLEGRSPVIVLSGAGAPTDLAARAARCALALKALLGGAPVALATGRAELSARLPVGELIDRAFQMLSADDDRVPGVSSAGVRIDEVTAGLLGARFDVAEDAAGRVLHGARDERTAQLLGKPTTYVGRERELAMLVAEIDRCIDEGAAGAVLVTAEAGMGKSRLQQELIRKLHERGDRIEVWIGQGDPMGAGSAFGLLASALRHALGLAEREPLEARQRTIRRRVEGHEGLDAPRVAAFLGELAGAPFPDENDVQLRLARRDAALMGDQLRLAWEDFLAAECRASPVLLVLEDLQWGDLPTVTLVEGALRRLKDMPLLVLALGRPDVHRIFPKLWEGRLAHELHLTPLPRRASERLVREALGADARHDLVARLVERADGNAFFLEEQIRAAAEGKSEGLPETVVAMVQARLETLDTEARRLLRAASIFGETFRSSAVAALLGGVEIAPLLAELQRREVIMRRSEGRQRDDAEYCFRHALVREAAYGMLTARDRRIGHALAGGFLEAAGEGDPMVLAEHFERGDEAARAAEWYLRAADNALRGNDLAAAIACAERGITCGPEPATVGALRLVQAEALLWRGEPALAEQRGLEATRYLAPGSVAWFSAFTQLAGAGHKQGDYERVERWMMAVLAAEPLAAARVARSTCLLEGAIVLLLGGRYARVDALIDAVEQATEDDPSAADLMTEAKLLYLHGLLRQHNGDPSASIASLGAALRAFEDIGDRREACRARLNMGICYVEFGHFEAAAEVLRAALEEAERMALDDRVPSALQHLGLALAHTGEVDAAKAALRSSIEALQRRGDPRRECEGRLQLARVLLLAGEPAAAEAEARAAEGLAAAAPERRPAAIAVRGRALLDLGRAGEALAATSEAASLLEAGRREEDGLLVQLVHAEALAAAGQRAEAEGAIAAARNGLLVRAGRISDPAWRERFLRDVPDHARLLGLAQRWLGDGTS
ncbi:serine/threonine protein kinase [Sorangium cellulosum]|uniref:Serine/threonine protein kinase n=1 Tax=Sorangium cellulosum TaxID=56 RepID=A0A2L0F3U3_SORCE|nr:protein kinase [Sorangium cellulosum]AUX46119.1 serine/threonine protein kinase [Sorangium cellulosum]